MEVDDMIPLRGFLICPKCGKTLSGSASTGRHSKYYYYHCTATCGCRYAAQSINTRFEEEIQKYTPHAGIVDLYRHIVSINYINKNKGKRDDLQHLNNQLATANKELATARHLLVTESIDPSDYRSIKTGLDTKISRFEAQISQLSHDLNNAEVKQLLEKASTTISNLHQLYHDGDVFYKRQIVGAIYPFNLEYSESGFRTARLNEVISTIYSLDAGFQKEKSVQNGAFSILYAREVSSGLPTPLSRLR